MRKTRLLLVAVLVLAAQRLDAEEGMWLLDQLSQLPLAEDGIEVAPSAIWSNDGPCLAKAVVHLGGTGELVSPEGLVLTNHHVAFSGLQRASTGGTDYIENGFLAHTREEELPAPGYTARVLERMEDVTAKVLAAAEGVTDLDARQRAVDAAIAAMTNEIEKGGKDLDAEVVPMLAGRRYLLYVFRRFDDVRIVYAPPSSIGDFGGDVDNWMWPRHTGDFTFLRVWMAPDGHGRAHDPGNVPYRPQSWLKVSSRPLGEGDPTFVLGYPAETTRYETSYSLARYLDDIYPAQIAADTELIELLDAVGQRSRELEIKAASVRAGVANRLKNTQGMVEAMRRAHLVDGRRHQEVDLAAWVAGDPARKQAYAGTVEAIEQELTTRLARWRADAVLDRLDRRSGVLVAAAKLLYTSARERAKPAAERDPLFSETDVERDVAKLDSRYLSYDPGLDQALLALTLKRAAELPAGQRLSGVDEVLTGTATPQELVAGMYSRTRFADLAQVRPLFKLSVAELDAVDDPLLDVVRRLYPNLEEKRLRLKASDTRLEVAQRRHLAALEAFTGRPLYPDANKTLRFTWGDVAGYDPRDAVRYLPFTTLTGVLEKDTGTEPFAVPTRLKEVASGDVSPWKDEKLGDVPVAFLHTTDITGGNSGSPVLDARGELVGVAFDGNWESLASDWQFDGKLQRTISVDIRYVLFVTEMVGGARHILTEMGLEPKAPPPPLPQPAASPETRRPAGLHTLVLLAPNPKRSQIAEEERKQLQEGHAASIDRLHKAGELLVAGPLTDGGGLFIMATPDAAEAERLVATDPAVAAGRFEVELRPFTVVSGALCPVGDRFTMVNYQLALYWPADTASPAPPAPFEADLGDREAVVLAGPFADGGGLILLDQPTVEAAEALLGSLPGGSDPRWKRQVRTVWIARNAFCR